MKTKTSPVDSMSYFEEPENYKALRFEIEGLMERINVVKSDFSAIAGTGMIYEQFYEQSSKIKRRLTQMVFILGEMHGYLLADDIGQNVHQK